MRFIILIFSLFLLFGGIVDTINGFKNPEPTRITVGEFAEQEEPPAWVVLTDAEINLLKAVVVRTSKKSKKIDRIYVPIESEEFKQKEKVSVLLGTIDAGILASAQEMFDLDMVGQVKYYKEKKDKLVINGELDGMATSSYSLSGSRVEKMRELIKNLDDKKFKIVNHHGKASKTRGIIITIIALIGIAVFFKLRKRKKMKKLNDANKAKG